MTLFPIEQVRGQHLVDTQIFTLSDTDIVPIEIAMTAYDGALYGARLMNVKGHPVYVLLGDKGSQMVDARSGQNWSGASRDNILSVAKTSYRGEGEVSNIEKLSIPPKDYSGALPVWQVKFDDGARTRFYIDPDTAEIVSVRTRLWRAFDFAWKFHIMDVTGEDNFNSWRLRLASGAALLFALSGFGLLWIRFALHPRRRRKKMAAT